MAAPSKEQARLGGKKSGEARRAKARLRADVRAKLKFEDAAEQVAGVLVQAALGQGKFERLDAKEQAQFAVKVLEYAVGRPRPTEPASQSEEPTGGVHIVLGGPQGDLIPDPPEAAREQAVG